MKFTSPSRRSLLAGGGAFALAGACAQETSAARPDRKVGIQLYTVRAQMQEDMPGTLRRIREIGYDEVEFAGYFNRSPQQVKQMLADIGLSAPSAHVARDLLRDHALPTLEAAATIGHQWIVFPWLPPEERTLDQFRAWADVCNRFGEQARAYGVRLAYHNHDFEFHPIEGQTPYDVLLERTEPSLVHFEADLYWVKKGGVDPLPFLEAHRDRITMCHVKDMDTAGNMADVGAGTIDFAEIFARVPFEHYFVERDDAPDPIASATASYAATRRLLDRA
ncbi:MAG TPA: sugar phosphate isomerase/epimerase [Caulobacterales bacterium]|nr:sugar phosphate isomerase/epimerase [Caulobacterales bacterium]